jgi:nucleoid-associated protein YgaU
MGLFGWKKDKEKDDAPAAGTAGGARRGADFSNVRSGGSSTAPARPATPPAAPPPAAAPERRHVVAAGDSLSKIAKKHYGDASQWRRIYEANRETIGGDPDLIHPGQDLVIPAAEGGR